MRQDWEVKKLGNVCQVIAGQSPESKYYNNEGKGLPFYQGKKEFTDRFIKQPTTWTTKITKEALAGDILMSVRVPVGPVNFSTEKICIGRGLSAIRVTRLVNREFLFHFLVKYQDKIVGNTGAVFNSINKTQIENIEIPLPSIAEQERIVEILDETLTGIATIKANTERNLKNARELFQSYLQSIFSNPGDDWEIKNLGEVCNFFNGFAFKSEDAIETSNTQLIRIGNLYQNKLDLERRSAYYPDHFCDTYKRYLLKQDDLLISLTGTAGKEDYGFTVKIPKTEKSLLLNQRVAKIIILNEKQITKDFLLYFLLSRFFLTQLYKTTHGTRQALTDGQK